MRRLGYILSAALLMAAGKASQAAYRNVVLASSLPAFSGADCSMTAGSGAISCSGLLAVTHAFSVYQNFNAGISVGANGANWGPGLSVGYNQTTYPSPGFGLYVSTNISAGSGETDFWNVYTSATCSFEFLQLTSASSASNLGNLCTSGFVLNVPFQPSNPVGTAYGGTGATTPQAARANLVVNGDEEALSTAGGAYGLTTTDLSYSVIKITGTLTSNSVIIMPNSPKGRWVFDNETSGSFGVYVSVYSQSAAALQVPQGRPMLVTSDGVTANAPLGQSNPIVLYKLSAAPAPPGAGQGAIFMVPGTTSGTCKFGVLAGTSTTPIYFEDNVGSGC